MEKPTLNVRWLSGVMTALLWMAPVDLAGQERGGVPGRNRTESLKIYVLTGEGAIHRVSADPLTEVVVEVRDRNDVPVEGAQVRFLAPETGPGGAFRGERVFVTRTNGAGQAVAVGFEPNQIEGRFQIRVEVSEGIRGAATVINQVNSLREGGAAQVKPGKLRKWLLIGGIAAGATALVVVLTGSSNSSTVSLTPGAVIIGGAR